MLAKLPKTLLYLLGGLLLANLLQSAFTPLIFDEAYYWYYAQEMAWGYFDHPPMVALLIKLSSFFFDGELGVRFMSCILSVGTFLVLWQLIDNPKKKDYVPQFFVLVFSMTLLNAYGFFTLPDTPLIFFTAMFLWVYKKFILEPTWPISIALGVVMAALMYSKYHAILVIVFVLLSNLKLLRNKYAWLAVAVSLVCYLPHLLWLYQHDFISVKYHLYERPNRAYDFNDFTVAFFVNLVAIFGLTFPWIYKSLFKTKVNDKFTRALIFLTYGIILFFFVSSFNRRVQTQWIIAISIPLAIISFNYMLQNKEARKWIYRMGLVNIAIILYLRLGLIYKPLIPFYYETHGNKELAQEIKSKIGDMPVVFENSYRDAPMYAFYTGSTTYSLNNIVYRKNQYSIDDSESKVQHKKVLYVSGYLTNEDLSFTRSDGAVYKGKYIDDFESFRKLKCVIEEEHIVLDPNTEHVLKVYNPYPTDIELKKIKFGLAYLNPYKQVQDILPLKPETTDQNALYLKARDTTVFTFKLPVPKTKNPNYFKVGISENGLYLGLNGDNIKLD
ncbi:glycosyltransferase family 39 protein [Flavobacteriaceae bacterium F89]|uniref:Glycosyltransferase family 39 protein n=1 Tax=Cerina litoralis TaxID=2874477 RepID=A0AAE3JP71_9FLAO|nr:glycosyltransferase family 39 protein [Cerina litoralis]MCG2460681.1 glycosyltransferase family 39 protein [Cerina litoralis]